MNVKMDLKTDVSGRKVLVKTAAAIKITGSKATKKLGNAGGKVAKFLWSKLPKIGLSSTWKFRKNLLKIGPANITAGIASRIPYINVLPMSAWKALTKTTGPGCGGKKQWVVESDAAIGMAMYNKGSLVLRARLKTKGTKMTNPAL
jgi:hypothetical protein